MIVIWLNNYKRLSLKFMVVLISKNTLIVDKLADALSESTGDLLKRDFKAIAAEFLAIERVTEQIELFKSEVNKNCSFDFAGKKLLELGCGVGTMLVVARTKYNIDAYGIEPSEDEFSPFNLISKELIKEHELPENIIVRGFAEHLPFEDESFDLIYSTNVLEHVQNPEKVLKESIRVLKKGGYLQFVIPNYFSFWEGHYGVIWPCLINKPLAKLYANIICQNPAYIDTLQLISPFFLSKVLSKFENKVEVLGWGKEIFKNRLVSGNYNDWASLKKIRMIVSLIQRLKLSTLLANIFNGLQMYTPIVLTLQKY